MNQDSLLENGNTKSSFGVGFVLGVIIGAAAIFFLATKTGRKILSKMNFADFDFGKLGELLEKEDFGARDYDEVKDYYEEATTPKPPILGKRFFRRNH